MEYDEQTIRIQADPPGKSSWTQALAWDSIERRVAFKAEGPHTSDGIYLFTSARPESYVIPIEAEGGGELWMEILRRGLFDAELAVKVAGSTGGVFVWPPTEG